MKKFIFILLITISIAITSNIVLAEVKFGSWDKWDEELPPAENKYWYWALSGNEPRTLTLKGFGDSGSDVVLLFSEVHFYGTKDGKTKASVIFYTSSNVVDIKNWDIPNADLALVAFPPKKTKMTIRAYKMEGKVFKFFEEWEISFKNRQVVVPKDAKFRQLFKEWLEKQVSLERPLPDSEGLTDSTLPELTIWKKKYFQISDGTKQIWK